MKKLSLLFIAVIAIFTSCQKEDTRPDCEKNNWGSFRVDSYLDDPYNVYVDGAYKGQVSAYGDVTYDKISSGTHATKYVQASGYVITPTEYTLSVNISDCSTFTAKLQ